MYSNLVRSFISLKNMIQSFKLDDNTFSSITRYKYDKSQDIKIFKNISLS